MTFPRFLRDIFEIIFMRAALFDGQNKHCAELAIKISTEISPESRFRCAVNAVKSERLGLRSKLRTLVGHVLGLNIGAICKRPYMQQHAVK